MIAWICSVSGLIFLCLGLGLRRYEKQGMSTIGLIFGPLFILHGALLLLKVPDQVSSQLMAGYLGFLTLTSIVWFIRNWRTLFLD
jgi:hypothetical protein